MRLLLNSLRSCPIVPVHRISLATQCMATKPASALLYVFLSYYYSFTCDGQRAPTACPSVHADALPHKSTAAVDRPTAEPPARVCHHTHRYRRIRIHVHARRLTPPQETYKNRGEGGGDGVRQQWMETQRLTQSSTRAPTAGVRSACSPTTLCATQSRSHRHGGYGEGSGSGSGVKRHSRRNVHPYHPVQTMYQASQCEHVRSHLLLLRFKARLQADVNDSTHWRLTECYPR